MRTALLQRQQHEDLSLARGERLTGTALDGLDVRSVVLEACGQLGAVHQHQHEKTDAVWSPAAARLLSVCCCARGWTGSDAERVREVLRAEVRRLVATGDMTAVDDERGVEQPPFDAERRADEKHGGERRGLLNDLRQRPLGCIKQRVLVEQVFVGVRGKS